MEEQVYKKLALKLDALPNGYPATQSGVELKILEKIFSLEEATLAAEMHMHPEPAGEIAVRAGVDPDAANKMLKSMVRLGKIRATKRDGGLCFGLMPFVVGFYEEQLPRLDVELASLVEDYFQEAMGSIHRDVPSLHRVIPVDEAVPFDLEIFPYEHASDLVEGAKAWAVRDCICRVQQKLVGKGCDHSVNNCLSFAPIEGYFNTSTVSRAITKEEALTILRDTEAEGLVHTTGNYRDGVHYICNCCTCCCGILRGVAEFNIPTAVAHSDFRSVVAEEICSGCEDCLARCLFGALSIVDGVCQVDYSKCVGCGLCAPSCETGAITLERRPLEDATVIPGDFREWLEDRAHSRGINLADS